MVDQGRADLERRVLALERENAQLRDVRSMLATVLQSAPNFITRIALDGTIRFINRVAPGFEPEQVIGTTVWDHTDPADHPRVRACLARVIETGQPDGYESREAGSHGELRHYYTRVGAIRDGIGGPVTAFILVATDITQLVEVRLALGERQAQLELAVAASGIGFWSWDVVRDRITWDDATCQAFGVTRATAPRQFAEVVRCVHPGDAQVLNDRIAEQVPTGRFTALEFRTLTPSGEVRWLMSCGESDRDASGRLTTMRGGIVDVTARRAMEENLAQARRLEAVGQLAAGVAHNFNNMLAAIIPTVELAARRAPAAAELLAIVRESAERSAGVVRQLMTFAGHRPGTTAHPESLATIATRTVALARAMLERQLEIGLDATPDLAVVVEPGEIEHLLMNLLLNARDALAGRVAARIDLQIAAGAPGWVTIRVCDNGVGMDDETRRRALEPFFTTKGLGRGTGLGLSSAYAVVRAHGGSLEIESAVGRGATIAIQLPAVAAHVAATNADDDHLRGHGEHLLLVDDDELVRSVLARVLEDAGYHVTSIGDPRSALVACERAAAGFDLLLLDESMPGLTGTQMLAQLLARDPTVRAVSLSGLDRPIAGAQAHLLKPVAAGELLRIVRGVLDAAAGPRR